MRSIDVRDQIQIFSSGGQHLKTLDVPVWTILDTSYDPSTNQVFLLESSFCHPPRIWHALVTTSQTSQPEFSSFEPVELFPNDNQRQPTTSTLSTKQVFYTSTDGTRIPMFLTSKQTGSLTPEMSVVLYVYGGFGISVVPHFRPDFVTFMHAFHGVVAIANIRGGGEYGQSWYQAACKEKRQALFDDIIGAANYLRTSVGSETIILMGESMGGLNCATAMVQRPDLFSAVMLNAGALDVLHRRRLGLGDRGAQDIGDIHDPAEFDFIHKWTPLDKVRLGCKYPPVLLTAGDKDDLVSYSNSCKMTAVLQYASQGIEGPNVTNLKVFQNLGHGGNISAKQKLEVSVDRWLWVKKALELKVHHTQGDSSAKFNRVD